MLSIKEIENRLDQELVSRLRSQYGELNYQRILRGFSEKKSVGIRINSTRLEFLAFLRQEWCKMISYGFLPYTINVKDKNENFFRKSEFYQNSSIYLQSFSSQLPVYFLDPKPWERILDMCASPGSKTTQIAMLTHDKALITANEPDNVRIQLLKANIDKQQILNVIIDQRNWVEYGSEMPESFDKVLLDAPCSAEWRININYPQSYKWWSLKNVLSRAKLQQRLMESAFLTLKSGWYLVYSTCTLNLEENENVISWILDKYGDKLKIEKISIDLAYDRLLPSKYWIKLMPNENQEGFYVVKLKKN